MSRNSSGLHKDVSSIFEGVWDPVKDNNQEYFEPPAKKDKVSKLQSIDGRPKESLFGGFVGACKEVTGFVFRTRARRERKRLLAISKHLMINIEG